MALATHRQSALVDSVKARLPDEARQFLSTALPTVVIRSSGAPLDLDPIHRQYAATHNYITELAEKLCDMDELAPLVDMIARSEEEYMPGGPPMSPLTVSYFSSWSMYDACWGKERETFGTIALALFEASGRSPEELCTVRALQNSRMGVYLHRGVVDNLALLQDIVTEEVHRAIVPSGYLGADGELWYVRLAPPPESDQPSLVFTTPYILLAPGLKEWQSYLHRVLPKTPRAFRQQYETHMKYGPNRHYWHEFVLEAYARHVNEAIFLMGLPDVDHSRPHSRVNEGRETARLGAFLR